MGKYLVHRSNGTERIGKIVEVEAYLGPHDLQSDELYIAEKQDEAPFAVVKKARIGVDYARHWAKRHLRFYMREIPLFRSRDCRPSVAPAKAGFKEDMERSLTY